MTGGEVWSNILAWSLQIGLVVGLAALPPVLFRLRVPKARLLYWQLLAAACLALPWLRPWRSEVIAIATPAATFEPDVAQAVAAAPVHALPSLAAIGLWVLAAGCVVRLILLAFGFRKLSGYRKNGREIPLPSGWNGIAAGARLLLSSEISGPVTFGFFNPVVLLPEGFPEMPEAMRDAILFHELLHVERRDWLMTVGEEVLRAAFWFHPAVWWVLGEIQLAREQTVDQAVIEMTQAREGYVDTLLAMAGVNPRLDLAPAPLFLRRRHLKQRVMGIVGDVRMSKTSLIFAQAAALTVLAAACWVVTSAIPLHAQSQLVMDSPGVSVNLNGSQLLHRTPVSYPVEARNRGVEGTVVAQVRLDAAGEVIDVAILSGPDELRRAVQQSVLEWHFDKSSASSTRLVNVEFAKPANAARAAVPAFAAGQPGPVATAPQITLGPGRPAMSGGRGGAVQTAPNAAATEQQPVKIEQIAIAGLAESATRDLRQLLTEQTPVHIGDNASPEALTQITEKARQFDSHLIVSYAGGGRVVWITHPEPPAPAPQILPAAIPAGAQRVGSNVMAANLISAQKPVYPPLAKMARQQGTVKFQATIGKDGTMQDLQVISGPPLLVPAAMEAVKNWIYKPTLLNGEPVVVVTTIDVNFTLADNAPAPPAQ